MSHSPKDERPHSLLAAGESIDPRRWIWHVLTGKHRRTVDGMRVGICNCGWRR